MNYNSIVFMFNIVFIVISFVFFSCTSEIPDSLLLEMQDVKCSKEFFNKFVEGGYINYTGEEVTELEESINNCQPVENVISIPPASDPTLFTIPKCIIAHRCQGCCGTTVLECVPLKTSEKSHRVSRFDYNRDKGLMELVQDEIFTVEEHVECGCKCKLNPSDCIEEQTHDERMCKCICNNNHKIADCIAADKIWNYETCRCNCREVEECSSGYSFNLDTCKCE